MDGAAMTEWFARIGGDAAAWVERNGAAWSAVQAASEARWGAFCREAERRVHGDTGDAQRFRMAIFGRCRRCGSERINVTTRQLRRADEGATEIHICRQCGHTRHINS